MAPRVDISVGSRFHAFELARELRRRGLLGVLYTGYPALAAGRFGLPRSTFASVWTHEPLNRIAARLFRAGVLRARPDAALSARFDRIVARRMRPGADVFVGWGNQCLASLARARSLGAVTVVERGSAHVEWQRDVLHEEAARTGLPVEAPDERTVARELEEYATADYVAVGSEFAARTFRERGFAAERLILNPYGVDLARFRPAARPDRPGLRVLHVGRVSVRKGVQYLVPAVAGVEGARLELVGEIDPGMERLASAAHVTAAGAIPGAELPARYAAADVFCLLSIEDGFPLVVLQALASGLPVITTPNVGSAQLIEDGVNGYLVPIRDPEAVADRLRRLRDDPERRRAMGLAARATAESGLGWSDYGERAAAAYRRIARTR